MKLDFTLIIMLFCNGYTCKIQQLDNNFENLFKELKCVFSQLQLNGQSMHRCKFTSNKTIFIQRQVLSIWHLWQFKTKVSSMSFLNLHFGFYPNSLGVLCLTYEHCCTTQEVNRQPFMGSWMLSYQLSYSCPCILLLQLIHTSFSSQPFKRSILGSSC